LAAPRNYYSEWDSYAAQWLRNLIARGLIPEGDVDERSIADVSADDLTGYTQCHFFAGIGGWPLALSIAGWPVEREVWTGSCPCQPFSAAGKRRGTSDERHLWPVWRPLIAKRRPAVVFGEQVASKDGRAWLAGVRTDLEAMGRRVGAADLCSAGVGSPNIRQRLYWVGDADGGRPPPRWSSASLARQGDSPIATGDVRRLADTYGGLARNGADERPAGPASMAGYWSAFDIVHCTDGKARRIEPGSFPLAHGVSNRVGRLRAYGNAINPWVAAEFVRSYLDANGCDDGVTLAQLAT
jgi:DNA (cytosine-5)-methyltransferase 1